MDKEGVDDYTMTSEQTQLFKKNLEFYREERLEMNAIARKYGINQDVLDNLEYYKKEGSIKEVYISDTNGSKLPGIFLYCELGNVDKYCNYMEYDFDSNIEAFIAVLSCSIIIMNTSMKQIYVATVNDIPNKIINRIERLV